MIRLVLHVCIAVAVTAASAHADPEANKEQARQEVEAADVLYKLGKFDEALAKYSRAYELYQAAPLLFNIAQCHKNLKQYEKAIFFYEGYLREAPDAPSRALVEDLLAESHKLLEQEQRDRQNAQPPPPPPPPPPQPQPQPQPQPIVIPPRTEPPHRSSPLVPVSLVAGGAAVAITGGVFYYYGQKRGPDEKFVYDDTRILGGTLTLIGVAATATGAYLLWRGHSSTPVAAAAPGTAYVGWAGTF